MWSWFKENPLKRIGGAIVAIAILLFLLKISAFIGSLLFKTLFLVAVLALGYVGFQKLAGKTKKHLMPKSEKREKSRRS